MLLEVNKLNIHFKSDRSESPIHAVRDLSFSLKQGEMLGVVGESGSGKSITNLALMGLLPDTAIVQAETAKFNGVDLLNLNERQWQNVRGREVAMIFQDPMTALNPFLSIQFQLMETIQTHLKLSKKDALDRCIELLTLVGIPSPKDRLKSYPFELSGGMAQRVMIAMAISTNPKLLIADEPTTALDVTIQKQILDLIKMLQEKNNMSVILVTHDLGVVSQYSENLQVMYAGEVVESGSTYDLITHPRHPYTHALLASRPGALVDNSRRAPKTALPSISGIVPAFNLRPIGCQFNPRCEFVTNACKQAPIALELVEPRHREYRCIHPISEGHQMSDAILRAQHLNKTFEIKKAFRRPLYLKALSDINFELGPEETLGIVGESGCGKSTLAKVLTKLEAPTDGNIELLHQNYKDYDSKEFHSLIQMVFQDPYQSLNPRKRAFDIIADPLRINTDKSEAEIKELVYAMMEKVGLRAEFGSRYPHHFSGGQRQRLGIARALMLRPRVLILDEPVSALDVSIQAQVLNLLLELQKEFSLSYLFISHDLSVIQHISDRIMVMYLGRIVEYGSRDEIFNNPKHPYTKILLESAPKIAVPETREALPESANGEIPSALYLPKGCAFAPRCPDRTDSCMDLIPELETKSKRMVACFNAK